MTNPRTVRILGMAPNIQELPPPDNKAVETWCSNDPKGYYKWINRVLQENEWTRWFNLHSRQHMLDTYPKGFKWYQEQDGTRPFYTQRYWEDIPGCTPFPHEHIQNYFSTSAGPNYYFTCSVCWLIAFAITEGFERIELWGFQLRDRKHGGNYSFERPCFFYWVDQARRRGITVWYQPEVEAYPFIVGDPDTYEGPLYGYETKPEHD